MLGNDTMETISTEVMSIRSRNDIEKSTWTTHWHFIDFESWIHVKISTSNQNHKFQVNLRFKIDIISTNLSLGISTLNSWRIDKDVSIGLQREYLWSTVNMLTNRKIILDITKRDILQLYFPQSYEKIW